MRVRPAADRSQLFGVAAADLHGCNCWVGNAQQSRLTALVHSSGELGLEWELEQDAPSVLDLVLELVSLV